MLNKQVRTALRRLHQDESGVALVAVMGFMLIGVLITVLIGTSIVSSLSHTTAARASVQAQAAAEAGIAAAFAGIQVPAPNPATCSAVSAIYRNVPGQLPRYEAKVYVGGGSTPSCPTGTGQVRIISTGWASAPGAAGNRSGDTAYVEATYAVGSVAASGSAVYIYNGGNVNGFTVAMGAAGTTGNVQMPTGNFNCTTASTINGDIVAAAGNVTLTNSCIVTGSVRASGTVTLDSTARVMGDIVASGGGVTIQAGNVVNGNIYANGAVNIFGTVEGVVEATGGATIQSGGLLKQTLKSGGNLSLSGTVNGAITATGNGFINGRAKSNVTLGGTLTSMEGNALIDGNLVAAGTGNTSIAPGQKRVGGTFTVGGTMSTWNYAWNVPSDGASPSEKAKYYLNTTNSWLVGAVKYEQAGLGSPAAPIAKPTPTVPAWVDWKYDRADWIAAGFANLITVPSSLCKLDVQATTAGTPAYNLVQQLQNANAPTVVDATACGEFLFSLSAHLRLKLKTDIAFISKSFKLEEMQIDSFDTTKHKLFFLVSDGQPTILPNHCSNGAGNFETNNGVIVGPDIAAMVYTPCTIRLNNGSKWRGQLYSGGIEVSAADGLTYVPVGIPGTNLDGVTGGGSAPGSLGGLVSQRNRQNDLP